MQPQTAIILLVEDNLFNRKIALSMLKKLGIQAEVAKNGQEAVEKMQQQLFSLVFMDCEMPILDGYEATRQIRADAHNPNQHTPIVAITAHVDPEHREMCREAGMDDYLAKPFQVDAIQAILKKFAVL